MLMNRMNGNGMLFGGALMAAGLAGMSEGQLAIGETTHNSGLSSGPYVAAYAGDGDYNTITDIGITFGPTVAEVLTSTGTHATVIANATEIMARVEKDIPSFGYFGFTTTFAVEAPTDVTIRWEAPEEITSGSDATYRVRYSSIDLMYYDTNVGERSGSIEATLQPGITYTVRGTLRTTFANPGGFISISPESVIEPCEGDANGDETINVADFISVLLNFGASGSDIEGDANGDEVVNVADFIAVLLNFGADC